MFHVPNKYRIRNHPILISTDMDGNNGAFKIKSPLSGRWLFIIANDGKGWEHVSCHVSTLNGSTSLPKYEEMCFLKNIFWDDEDVVVQYHPKKSEYINNHPYTLHLWRPTNKELPYPESILVGLKENDVDRSDSSVKKRT